jgi:Beta propeller domain
VATSTQSALVLNDQGVWESTDDSTSQVSILEFSGSQNGRMPLVGKVSDLGKTGTTIHSVQFVGDKGFVVMSEPIGPFYTLDLSTPTNPQVAGKLEIPGYSSYLHPVGDDLILGVGQAAEANVTTLGLQISLFDVSDFANPKRVQNFQLSSGHNSSSSSLYTSNAADYNHKAFRYLPDSGRLIVPDSYYETVAIPCGPTVSPMPVDANGTIVPASQCTAAVGFDGFRVFEVSSTAGIGEYFLIGQASGCWSSAWFPPRSFVFEDEIITFKGNSILSNDLTTMKEIADPIFLYTDGKECDPWVAY